jgi:hypothetical protein
MILFQVTVWGHQNPSNSGGTELNLQMTVTANVHPYAKVSCLNDDTGSGHPEYCPLCEITL